MPRFHRHDKRLEVTSVSEIVNQVQAVLQSRLRPVHVKEIQEVLDWNFHLRASPDLIRKSLKAEQKDGYTKHIDGDRWETVNAVRPDNVKADWVWPPYVPGYLKLAAAVEPSGWRLLWINNDRSVCSNVELDYGKHVPNLPNIDWPFVDGYEPRRSDFMFLDILVISPADEDLDEMPDVAVCCGLAQAL